MKRSIPPPTVAESERIDRMMEIGCIVTWLRREVKEPAECQHIKSGTDVLGWWYTIPLTPYYHRGVWDAAARSRDDMIRIYGASVAHGSKEFAKSHGKTELDYWQILQRMLELDDTLPVSKIFPRSAA